MSLVITTVFDPVDIRLIIFVAYAFNVFVHSTNGTLIENVPLEVQVATTVAPLLTSIIFPVSALPIRVMLVPLTVCDAVLIVGVDGALLLTVTELPSVVVVTVDHVLLNISA